MNLHTSLSSLFNFLFIKFSFVLKYFSVRDYLKIENLESNIKKLQYIINEQQIEIEILKDKIEMSNQVKNRITEIDALIISNYDLI